MYLSWEIRNHPAELLSLNHKVYGCGLGAILHTRSQLFLLPLSAISHVCSGLSDTFRAHTMMSLLQKHSVAETFQTEPNQSNPGCQCITTITINHNLFIFFPLTSLDSNLFRNPSQNTSQHVSWLGMVCRGFWQQKIENQWWILLKIFLVDNSGHLAKWVKN